MKKTFIGFLAMTVLPFLAFAHGDDTGNAAAAEISLHQIERWANPANPQIDVGFRSKIQDMQVAPIAHQGEEDPAYKVTVNQYAGPDGKKHSIDLLLAEDTTVLSKNVTVGTDPTSFPTWGNLMAVTFMQNSMHLLLDNWKTDANLAPYFRSMTNLVLTPEQRADGTQGAYSDVVCTETAKVLRIHLKADSKFDKYELL